jgi:hypothetical protein
MGSVDDSYDNALMENFFSTLETELVYRSWWRTREEAENALFASIASLLRYSLNRRTAAQIRPEDLPSTHADALAPAVCR